MSRSIRNILIAVCAIVSSGCLAAAYLAGVSYQKPLTCKSLDITIADSTTNNFVSREDVRGYLERECGSFAGVRLDSIGLDRIESVLESKSAINSVESFVTKDGKLNIVVTQRKPAVRFQSRNGGYYADAAGRTFPLQSSYASYVPVIDGNIPSVKDTMRIARLTSMVNYLEGSSKWEGKFVQISIDDKGNVSLIPREGKERFIIGQPQDIEEKAEKMEMYYTHILPEKGSGHYRTVDLRYDGQIVCR